MLKVIPRFDIIESYGPQEPRMIVLHDTAGPSVRSAEQTFQNERPGLGYHFMVAKDGTVFQYAHTNKEVWHAKGYNHATVSISFAGGGNYGVVTEAQISSAINLINDVIKPACSKLTSITGHKHCSPKRKFDPRFDGENPEGVNYVIDQNNMSRIALATVLTFRNYQNVEHY